MESVDIVEFGIWAETFAELTRRLANISEKVLTAQLRQLERDGVVSRTVTADIPPKVSYSLTAEGMELVKLMHGLCEWGSEHFGIQPTMGTPPFLQNQPASNRAVQNRVAKP